MKKLLVVFIIFSSCKKDVYHYPSQSFFDENNPKEIIIDNLYFRKIVDSIRNGLYKNERYFITLKDYNSIIKISPLAYTGGFIKQKNILEIVNDSLCSGNKMVSINKLREHIILHYENNGKLIYLPDSYKRAFMQLNLDAKEGSENFKQKLLNIIQVYNSTNFKYKDSVNLDIMLNYNLDKIYPQPIPPPPTIPSEIED